MAINPQLGLILAAGGSGNRFTAGQNKLMLTWRGLPVFCHCLKNFLPLLNPAHIVLAVPTGMEPMFREQLRQAGLPDDIRIVAGGANRQDSVMNALQALPPAVTLVAVQDAARPCTTMELLARCVDSAVAHGSGVAARRVTDTVKIADAAGRIKATPDRSTLWAAETPQVYRRELLESGYARIAAAGSRITDDAQAVEALGETVYLVENSTPNLKITYPDDLRLLPTDRE